MHHTVHALDLSDTAWEAAGQPYDLEPTLLYAIAIMESGRAHGGGLTPWPWTLSIPDRGGRFFASQEEAMLHLQANRNAAVDVGMMQVNARHHGHRVATAEALLEPATNLEGAAAILAEAIASAPADPELGVGRYHSPNEERARNYGRTVLQIKDRLDHLSPAREVP